MKMAYWMRIGLGALLGIVTLLALWGTLGISWLTGSVSALLALIGFLGSYFVVSADRPEEGYEQVLFDRPNTLVALAMVVVFAGAGIGTGFFGGPGMLPSPDENVRALGQSYQLTATEWNKNATADETRASLATLREESDRIAAELELLEEGDARTQLEVANDKLAFAIDALKDCVEKGTRSCLDARIHAADAESALTRYAASAS